MTSTTALPLVRPFVNGEWVDGTGEETVVRDKFSDAPVTRVMCSDRDQVRAAVGGVAAAAQRIRLSQYERYRILSAAAALVERRREELAEAVRVDTGFVAADVTREVERTQETLQLCAEEARRLAGEVVPLEGAAGQRGRFAYTRFDPLGVVCAITPFNSPLNTVAHKVGPALAAGNAVILKPAMQTPRSADALIRLLLDAGVPPQLVSVVYGGGSTVGQWLTEDQRIAYYAFTGSTRVGEALYRAVGMRRTQLEMGSLASTIICADADLERASRLALTGAFRKSGQVCTSVQRLYVHRDVVGEVTERLTAALRNTTCGDPADPASFVGPLISPADAERVKAWIDEAVDRGAAVVSGGGKRGNVVEPTVLTRVSPDSTIMQNEVFGPVVLIREFTELAEAINDANATPYGLAAGIFTRDIGSAMEAAEKLQMGAVHINETSSSRVDLMPFTGVKRSGFGGAEGPRYAIRDMSQERLITVSRP